MSEGYPKMLFVWRLVYTTLLIASSTAETCPPPVHSLDPYVLSETVDSQTQNPPDLILQYQSTSDSAFDTFWTCTLQSGTHDCTPGPHVSTLTPFSPMSTTITGYANGTYRAAFTISSMHRRFDFYKFRWTFGATLFGICEVEMYYFDVSKCDQPSLEYKDNVVSPDNIQVTVNCDSGVVYPLPTFHFTGNGEMTEHDAKRLDVSVIYYQRQCTITTPVANLVPKLNEYQVLIYLNVTNGEKFGRTVTSPSIDLSLPKPTCDDPHLNNNNNEVNVTCTISSIFTGFTCNFMKKTGDNGDFQPIGPQNQITSSLSSCSNSPSVSCDSHCTLTVSVSELGVGMHRFKVSMTKGDNTTDSDATGTINFYAGRVTKYTVQTPSQQVVVQDDTNMDNSDSSKQLQVLDGTNVTFVCEGEGNPRPEVKVKSQRSISPIPSQVTSSGSYDNKAVATKTMACRDTAFYECEAFNGIGVASAEDILVSVQCAPELSEEDKENKTYITRTGNDLQIEIKILGHPPPNNFPLTKIVTRINGSTDTEKFDLDRYNVTFKSIDELYGQVTLVMYNTTDRDIGQYQLDIQNGIGDDLTYRFSVDIAKVTEDSSSNIGVVLGVIAGLLVVAAVAILIIIFLRKRGFIKACVKKKEPKSPPDPRDFDAHRERKVSEDTRDPVPINSDGVSGDVTNENKAGIKGQKGNAYEELFDQPGGSQMAYEHPYNVLQDDSYDALESSYEPIDRRAEEYTPIESSLSTLKEREASYEDLSQVDSRHMKNVSCA